MGAAWLQLVGLILIYSLFGHRFSGDGMTNEQFDCCLTGRSATGAEAARLVLVHGVSVKDAAQQTGLEEQSVRNAMQRIKKRFNAICAAGPWPTGGK